MKIARGLEDFVKNIFRLSFLFPFMLEKTVPFTKVRFSQHSISFFFVLVVFALVPFHGFPKAGIGAVADVFGDLLEGGILSLHELVGDAHAYCDELLAEAMPRILQNEALGMAFGNMKLLGKVAKIDILIVIENEKFADEEVIILDFGNAEVLLMIAIAKQGNIEGNCAIIARELALLNLTKKGFYDADFDGIGECFLCLAVGLKGCVQEVFVLIRTTMHSRCRNGQNGGTVDRYGSIIDEELCSSLTQHMNFGIVMLVQRGIGFW